MELLVCYGFVLVCCFVVVVVLIFFFFFFLLLPPHMFLPDPDSCP